MIATITNMDMTTSIQDQVTAPIRTLDPVETIDGMASVLKTVEAIYRRCDLGTDSTRTMSKQTQTTTTVCPMAIRICPGTEPANMMNDEPNIECTPKGLKPVL